MVGSDGGVADVTAQDGVGAAIEKGVVLELNTSSGIDLIRGLCPSAEVVGWAKQAGGRAVALGSDAHRPDRLGAGFMALSSCWRALGLWPQSAAGGCAWRPTPSQWPGEHPG